MAFNSIAFLNARGKNKTSVKTVDEMTLVLDGMPKKYTATEMVKVAAKTFKTTVRLPKGEVAGNTVRPRSTLTGKDVTGFVAGICGIEADNDAPGTGEAPKAEGEAPAA